MLVLADEHVGNELGAKPDTREDLGFLGPDAGAGVGAQEPEVFSGVGLRAELVADVLVREDEHVLVTRPNGTDPLPVRVWLAPAD